MTDWRSFEGVYIQVPLKSWSGRFEMSDEGSEEITIRYEIPNDDEDDEEPLIIESKWSK